jgi:eukaryotic-like serine/threonine-protein kinase
MMAAPATPVRDCAAFVDALRRSGLLAMTQIDRALKEFPVERTSANDGARRFVALGLLTAFQVKRLLSGKTDGFFLGPYVMLEPLGDVRGGKVYRARHRAMNRVVAIKLLTPDRTRSEAMREAFQSATRAAVQLLHPNIVTTFDANQCGERMYAVLEFATGRDLGAYVRESSQLPVKTACAIARQIALALAHAHDRGVVHGLLNPDNVLVGDADADGAPAAKVLNFGYGRLAAHYANDATRQLDGAIAVADHLAPESFDPARPPGPAADLFSLGCLLHFLLTARPPTGDRPVHQFANRHGVERWRPGLSAELVELVRSLLQQNPNDRPRSAQSVADRLDRLATGRGTDELALPDVAGVDERIASPFAGLDTVPDIGADATAEQPVPARPRTPREPIRWSAAGTYLLAAGVILATGAAIAFVLRSMVR